MKSVFIVKWWAKGNQYFRLMSFDNMENLFDYLKNEYHADEIKRITVRCIDTFLNEDLGMDIDLLDL